MLRLAGLLVLCLALSACGKSTEEKYKDGFPPINRGLVALGTDVEQGLREANDKTLASDFGGYASRLGRLRAQLDDLEAPDRLANDHAALLDEMTAVRGALADVAAAARRGDPTAARDAATRLVQDGARLDQARARLAEEVRGL